MVETKGEYAIKTTILTRLRGNKNPKGDVKNAAFDTDKQDRNFSYILP